MLTTVKHLIETLNKYYDSDEEIVVTWWTKEDIEFGLNGQDLSAEEVAEVWNRTNEDLEAVIDSAVEYANDQWKSDRFYAIVDDVLEESH